MTKLLGRYGEALFWFARYIERAASLARILNVQAEHYQGRQRNAAWKDVLSLYTDVDRFSNSYGKITALGIAKFYIHDRDNIGSIRSSVRAARENARLLRPMISVSMWSYLNVFYSELSKLKSSEFGEARLSQTCAWIAERCDAIMGVTEATLYRDAGWRFYQLGLWTERADQTSRLLDVKFSEFNSEFKDKETGREAEFWYLLLRSFEAYHTFQRVESGRIDPGHVADFLMFDENFPRSLAHCFLQIEDMLNDLGTKDKLLNTQPVCEKVKALDQELAAWRNDPLVHERFHGFSDKVQRGLVDLTDALDTQFFYNTSIPPAVVETPAPKQRAPSDSANGKASTATQSAKQKQSSGKGGKRQSQSASMQSQN